MDIEHIKSFCAVAEFKSFRKAAEVLQVTQPGVSRRIKGLENELGVTLLQRTPQSVSLTNEGKNFLPYAERTIRILEEGLKQTLDEVSQEKLAIGGTPTICHNILPDVIKQFKATHDLSITLYTVPSSNIFDMVVDQTIDIGFTSAFFSNSLLTNERIFSEKIICVGSPEFVDDYFSNNKVIKQPVPIIYNNLNTDPWIMINNYLMGNPLYRISVSLDTTRVAERLARKGVGLAFLPYSDAVTGITTGQLVPVTLSDFELPHRPVYMVTYKDRQLSPAILRFKKDVKDLIDRFNK